MTVCSVALTEDGLEAIITLARGDMRKCLNILQVHLAASPVIFFTNLIFSYNFCCSCQATHMSFGKADAASVYGCTGQPQPADIEYALDLLLNESVPKAYSGA
jgi:replication factor C subunit 3/5